MTVPAQFDARLDVRTVDHQDQYFNRKLVFLNLEGVLSNRGYRIERVETRQDGRESPPALRIKTNYSSQLVVGVAVGLRVVQHDDTYYQQKLVFDGLEETLKAHGFLIEWCSTRESGQHSSLAIRVTLGEYS